MSSRLLGLAMVWVLLLTGCTAAANAEPASRRSRADNPDDAQAEALGAIERGTVPDGASYIARITRLTSVHDAPEGEQIGLLDPTTTNGSATALAVVGEPDPDAAWIQVMLDQRPNASVGWIWAGDVDITWTTLHIEVDLAERELRLFDGAELIVRGAVGIGKLSTPTPTGTTYVTDILATPDPDTLYGPFALGLAMYSDVVTEYAGGDGQAAIHGTNSPTLLGLAVSLGCVRVHNDLIRVLAGRVPLGTPVLIH
ncbi:MAG: L,D-transpeptidase family protein [Actinomycetia bacterium]|nr:L,D-transpeptidase family protein [Actinomycetes bacterium]